MSRPSTPLIDRAKAVELSIELIQRDGLDSFSLPKLAAAMNVKTPSLYHHFTSRSDLAASVAAEVVRRTAVPTIPEDPIEWKDWIVQLALNFREVIFRYRRTAALLLEHVPSAVFAPIYEECAELLARARVPAAAHFQILDGLETIVFGATTAEAAQFNGTATPYSRVNEESHPAMARALAANTMDATEVFEARVRGFLDGVLIRHA